MKTIKKVIKKKALPKKKVGGPIKSSPNYVGKKTSSTVVSKKGTRTTTDYETYDTINSRKKNSSGTTRADAMMKTYGKKDPLSKKIYNTALNSKADSIYITKDKTPKVFDSNTQLLAMKKVKKTITAPKFRF